MQKIMFNEKYGLQRAAIAGTKSMTRRSVPDKWQNPLTEIFEACNFDYSEFWQHPTVQLITNEKAPYKVGEVVAIAQSYKDAGYTKEWVVQNVKPNPKAKPTDPFENRYPGWNNKMFVKAELMPHRIRITDIKIERLQDISVRDCLREGIVDIHLPILYPTGNHAYTFDGCSEGQIFGEINGFCSTIAAFAALIDKVSGRGTWDRNPWVFAYSFELIK